MAFSYVAFASGNSAAAGTSLNTSSTLAITAGDVLVVWCSWEGGTAGTIGCSDGGSNTCTMEAETLITTYVGGAFGIITAATANANATFTFTNSTSRAYRSINVYQFRPDSGDTIAKDATNPATGTATSIASGSINTAGDDEITVGAVKMFNSRTLSSRAIGGTGATGTNQNADGLNCMWYRILSASASGIQATVTASSTTYWVCSIMSIKATAPAGGLSIPVAMHHYMHN